MNRVFYSFNSGLDRYVARPIATTYVRVVPELARTGVDNFVSNATYPVVIGNDLLQLKFWQFANDLARILMNTTIGIGGLLDVATDAGLPKHDEDFSQTLGYWGLGDGIFLMMPLLGPTTGRDLFGLVADRYMEPSTYLSLNAGLVFGTLGVLNKRANLLDIDGILDTQLDPYIFVRNAYLQRRLSLVHDGSPPLDPLDLDEEEDALVPPNVVPTSEPASEETFNAEAPSALPASP